MIKSFRQALARAALRLSKNDSSRDVIGPVLGDDVIGGTFDASEDEILASHEHINMALCYAFKQPQKLGNLFDCHSDTLSVVLVGKVIQKLPLMIRKPIVSLLWIIGLKRRQLPIEFRMAILKLRIFGLQLLHFMKLVIHRIKCGPKKDVEQDETDPPATI
jgi:hypothetical protein